MFIPIGVDCGMENFFKKYNLRNSSFPFDWVVTYNGISTCIDNNFKNYIELDENKINEYDVYFHHERDNFTNEDKEKYIRRCNRVINILETTNEEIVFCRKGHAHHHHYEHNGKYFNNIKNEIDECEKLNISIRNKYPHLKYKIILILVCGKCFNREETYKRSTDKIEIYNISTPDVDDELFEKSARNIFKV
jgi:hypothetical protein